MVLGAAMVAWINVLTSRVIEKSELEAVLEHAAVRHEMTVTKNSGTLAPRLSSLSERLEFVKALRVSTPVTHGDRILIQERTGYIKATGPGWKLKLEIFRGSTAHDIYLVFTGSGVLKGQLRTVIPADTYNQLVGLKE